jgi:hypothetical protein
MMGFIRVTSLLLFAAMITSFLSVPITTASYTIWLSSIDMPTTLNLFIASLIHDWFNLGITLFLLFLLGFLLAFLITFVIRRYFSIQLISEPVSYAIAGNRTSLGAILHIFAGYIGGYFFGYFLNKM